MATTDGEALNFCANNYLGLADDPEVLEAVRKGMETHGFGMASVRFICGTQDIHKELEAAPDRGSWAPRHYPVHVCFDANTGLFETLLGPEDALISDSLNHASIIDGVRLCRAQRKIYQARRHGRPEGEAEGDAGRSFPADRHRRGSSACRATSRL